MALAGLGAEVWSAHCTSTRDITIGLIDLCYSGLFSVLLTRWTVSFVQHTVCCWWGERIRRDLVCDELVGACGLWIAAGGVAKRRQYCGEVGTDDYCGGVKSATVCVDVDFGCP